MHAFESEHLHDLLEVVHHHHIPSKKILGWIDEYGWPVFAQVMPAMLSGDIKGLSLQEIIAWAGEALTAVANSQPLPPLPKHGAAKPAADDKEWYTRDHLSHMTVEELKKLAADTNIDLAGITLKDDIVKAILKASKG